MTTGQLILIIVLVLVAAGFVALILLRGSAQSDDGEAPVPEAPAGAQEPASTTDPRASGLAAMMAGLPEPEVSEPEPPEPPAAEMPAPQPVVEAGQDVREPVLPEVRAPAVEPEPVPPAPAAEAEPMPPAAAGGTAVAEEPFPMTRAERRRAREEAELRAAESSEATDPAAPADGGVLASWGLPAPEGTSDADEERSARIASAADYRDDTDRGPVATGTASGADPARADEASEPGRHAHQETSLSAEDTESPSGEWGGPPGSGAAGVTGEVATEAEPVASSGTPAPETDDEVVADSEGDAMSDADDTAHAGADDVEEEAAEEQVPAEEPRGRRISAFHEIRDGGYGVGSAAPFPDRAQPMDHPVAAYRDTMSYRAPGDPGYDDTEPDVWFYDEGAAERSGFHHADG